MLALKIMQLCPTEAQRLWHGSNCILPWSFLNYQGTKKIMKNLKWWIQLGLRRYEQSLFISVCIVALPREISGQQGLIVPGTLQAGKVCPREAIIQIYEYHEATRAAPHHTGGQSLFLPELKTSKPGCFSLEALLFFSQVPFQTARFFIYLLFFSVKLLVCCLRGTQY